MIITRERSCIYCLHCKKCPPSDKLYENRNGACKGYMDVDYEIDYNLAEDNLYSWERYVDTSWEYMEDEE